MSFTARSPGPVASQSYVRHARGTYARGPTSIADSKFARSGAECVVIGSVCGMTETAGEPGRTAKPSEGSLWKYVGWFVVGCVLMIVLWALIDLIIGRSGVGVAGIVAPFIGAYFAVDHFLADHERVPDKSEKRWLIWVSFGVTMIWSVIVGVAVLLVAGRDEIDDAGAGMIGGIAVGAVLLTLLMTWAGYSYWPKPAVRNRQRQAARREAKGQ